MDSSHLADAFDRAELIEELAAIEHSRWAHWQRYVHESGSLAADGSLTIPNQLVSRWTAQIETPYSQLSESEKESDREQVRRYLPLLMETLRRQLSLPPD